MRRGFLGIDSVVRCQIKHISCVILRISVSNFRNFYTLIIKPNNSFVLSLSPLSCYLVALHVQVSLFCSVIVQILRPLSLSSLFTGFTNSEETFAILFIRFKTNVD